MDQDRVRRLADRLDATSDEMFYMGNWHSEPGTHWPVAARSGLVLWLRGLTCGTAACVAGHVNLMRRATWTSWYHEAVWLGIRPGTATKLFQPRYARGDCPVPMNDLTVREAAATVRHLLDEHVRTGREVVDWFVFERRYGRIDRRRVPPRISRLSGTRFALPGASVGVS